MIESVVYAPRFGQLVLRPLVEAGYAAYRRTGRSPRWAYRAMRKLFAADPAGFEAIAERSRRERPLLVLDPGTGVAAGVVEEAVAALDETGLYVLPAPLDPARCDELEALALAAECRVITDAGPASATARFDPERPAGIRLDLREEDLLAHPAVQALLADESLLAVAQGYFRAAPVQDMVAMWWSAAGAGPASSAAAQLFHFDLDRLRFLKVFVYLTDVDDRNGPHAFVRGTHRRLPDRFRRDGRYADADVEAAFGEAVVRVGGRRGTVFLADTRALHKGEPLREGHRLVFQIELSTSLFGQEVTRPQLDQLHPALAGAMARFPDTYRRLSPAGRAAGP